MIGFHCQKCGQPVHTSLPPSKDNVHAQDVQQEKNQTTKDVQRESPTFKELRRESEGTTPSVESGVTPFMSTASLSEQFGYFRSLLSSRSAFITNASLGSLNVHDSSEHTDSLPRSSHTPLKNDDTATDAVNQITWLTRSKTILPSCDVLGSLRVLEESLSLLKKLRDDPSLSQAIISASSVTATPPALSSKTLHDITCHAEELAGDKARYVGEVALLSSSASQPRTDLRQEGQFDHGDASVEEQSEAVSDDQSERNKNNSLDRDCYTTSSVDLSQKDCFQSAALLCMSCLGTLTFQAESLISVYREGIEVYEDYEISLKSMREREQEAFTLEAPIAQGAKNSTTEDISSSKSITLPAEQPVKAVRRHSCDWSSSLFMASSRPHGVKQKAAVFKNIQRLKIKLSHCKRQAKAMRKTLEKAAKAYVYHQVNCLKRHCAAASLEALTFYTNTLISPMSRFNVINDAFHIWAEGPYGTINGLKLGKTPNDTVPWDEVNAAWGQTAFLLDSLIQATLDIYHQTARKQLHAKRASVNSANTNSTGHPTPPSHAEPRSKPFKALQLDYLLGHRILPRGSQSAVLRRSDAAIFELYGNTGGITRFFAARRFDTAMLIILELVKDLIFLANFLRKHFAGTADSLSPPCEITKDTVGGASIRLPSAMGSHVWCRSLKSLLVNLKWLIGVVEELDGLAIFAEGSDVNGLTVPV